MTNLYKILTNSLSKRGSFKFDPKFANKKVCEFIKKNEALLNTEFMDNGWMRITLKPEFTTYIS